MLVGPEGGEPVEPNSVHVSIPAGAIAPGATQQVSVEIRPSSKRLCKYSPVVSPVVRLEPSDCAFLKPVTVTLPHCLARPTRSNLAVTVFNALQLHDSSGAGAGRNISRNRYSATAK